MGIGQRILLLGLFVLGVSGCAAVVIGGAAATVAVGHDRRTTGAFLDDQNIELKVSQAVSEDKRFNPNTVHVGVTSYNGVVLLTGAVPDAASQARVEALAQRVERVRAVHNELILGQPSDLQTQGNDTLITARVKTALLQINLPDFDATRVKVTTSSGMVYLMGLVTQREGNAAAEQARQIGGVRRVIKLFEYLD